MSQRDMLWRRIDQTVRLQSAGEPAPAWEAFWLAHLLAWARQATMRVTLPIGSAHFVSMSQTERLAVEQVLERAMSAVCNLRHPLHGAVFMSKSSYMGVLRLTGFPVIYPVPTPHKVTASQVFFYGVPLLLLEGDWPAAGPAAILIGRHSGLAVIDNPPEDAKGARR